MLLRTGGLSLLMPKFMDSMDPEEIKKMQEQTGNSNNHAAMLKSLFGGGDDDEPAEKAPSKKLKGGATA